RAAARSPASPACSARCPATARRHAASCRKSVLDWGLLVGSCHSSMVSGKFPRLPVEPPRSTGNFLKEKSSTSLGVFSVLVSRLRAAAHALFPPRGEEKKSEVEAERHDGLRVPTRGGPAWAELCGMICSVRRLALIVNPVAGGGRPARALPGVQADLR